VFLHAFGVENVEQSENPLAVLFFGLVYLHGVLSNNGLYSSDFLFAERGLRPGPCRCLLFQRFQVCFVGLLRYSNGIMWFPFVKPCPFAISAAKTTRTRRFVAIADLPLR